MAVTRVSDIIVPEVFNQYVIEESTKQSAFYQSGVIQTVPNVNVPDGGDRVNVPFWNDLQGDPQAIQSNRSLDVQKVTSNKDVARVMTFGQAWSAEDLAAELAGDDPMQMIASRVGAYWTRSMQLITLRSLDGVYADNLNNDNGDLIHDVSIDDGANATEENKMNGEHIIDGSQLLGDAKGKFTALAVHSKVHANMQKNSLIEYIPEDEANVGWGTYMGKSVIVDDELPVEDAATSGKKYTSYLFAQGAVGYEEGTPKVPTETDRDSLAGEDILINRRRFIMHPRGFRWEEGKVAGEMPTLSELADPTNYDRAYQKKNTRIVKMITNG